MSRFVTFNGQTLFKPGGLTRVNANALTPIGLSATGILGLIGEANGGAPGATSGPVNIDDPALAEQIFGSGPLADAIKIAFDPSSDPRIPGGAFRCVCYKTNQSTPSGINLPDTTAFVVETLGAGSTTTAIHGTVTATLNQYAGRWLQIGTEKRRIVSNTASATPIYTVSPGFSTAPLIAATANILNDSLLWTSTGYGSDQNSVSVEFEAGVGAGTFVVTLDLNGKVEQSPDLGGLGVLILKYAGGPIPANGSGVITAATTSTISVTLGGAPGLNAFAGMVAQLADGTQRLIATNTNASAPCVITLDPAHAITTAEATAIVGTTLVVRGVTSCVANILGASGKATQLTSVAAPTADNLAITFAAGMTLRQLVNQVNATTNYVASYPAGVNPDTTVMADFDFGTRNTAVDVRFDQGISPTTKGNFHADVKAVTNWVNTFATLATVVRASAATTDGAEVPGNTGGLAANVQDIPVFFVGGARGISSNSNFQAGFDALLQVRVNQIVPLVAQDLVNEGNGSTATFASVAAQASAHVSQCAGIGRSERGGYVGGKLTKTQLLAEAAALNNPDIELFGQKLTVLDSGGDLVQQPEWSIAVAAAGMRCGAPEVGTPLTFKFLKTQGLAQDPSWSPRSITDQNALLAGGVMFAEQLPTGGFRFVRDLTTYLIDDNDAYINGDTRDAVRFVAYDLRTFLENQFTGLKASPANVANIREQAAAKLVTYVGDNILIPSLDPETLTTTVPGWRRLRVFITGNVATVRVEIFPCEGIVFQLNDIFLQLPRLAA